MELEIKDKNNSIIQISDEDFEMVSQHKWHVNKDGYVKGQANGKKVFLHRFILSAQSGQVVDHSNGDKLDNRRENLKITTYQKNSENRKISKSKKSSQFRGVYYHKNSEKYVVYCMHDGINNRIGCFNTEIEAAESRDIYVVQNNLSHIQLNFPEKKDEYLQKDIVAKKQKTSKYYGVYKRNSNNKYCASICINDKNIYLLESQDEIECAKAYDKYIVDHNILSKKLNFPNDHSNYDPNSVIKTLFEKINNKTIRLLISDEMVTIDKEDYDKIKYYKWYIDSHSGYVFSEINGKTTRLHRYIMNVTETKIYIDHIDNNKLNNSKTNLRISDAQKNAQNKSKMSNTTSKYTGVNLDKGRNKWVSKVIKNNKPIFTAYDFDEINCARKRDLFILKNLKDDHYKLNFKWSPKEVIEWENNFKEKGYIIKMLNQ